MSDNQISEIEKDSGEAKKGPFEGFRVFSKKDRFVIVDKKGNHMELSDMPTKFFLKHKDDTYHFYIMWSVKNPTEKKKKECPF